MTTYVFGNYTYTLTYIFKMNGAIEVRVGSTGTTLNRGVQLARRGRAVRRERRAEHRRAAHQHFFNFRIDFDVDGVNNRLVEENTSSDAELVRQRVRDAGDGARGRAVP